MVVCGEVSENGGGFGIEGLGGCTGTAGECALAGGFKYIRKQIMGAGA